jgi:hypothetical protein
MNEACTCRQRRHAGGQRGRALRNGVCGHRPQPLEHRHHTRPCPPRVQSTCVKAHEGTRHGKTTAATPPTQNTSPHTRRAVPHGRDPIQNDARTRPLPTPTVRQHTHDSMWPSVRKALIIAQDVRNVIVIRTGRSPSPTMPSPTNHSLDPALQSASQQPAVAPGD